MEYIFSTYRYSLRENKKNVNDPPCDSGVGVFGKQLEVRDVGLHPLPVLRRHVRLEEGVIKGPGRLYIDCLINIWLLRT